MQFGASAALFAGLEPFVFTGGIGSHAAAVRAESCHRLEHLGVRLEEARNTDDAPIISRDDSPVTVRTIETDEDVMIAHHTHDVLAV